MLILAAIDVSLDRDATFDAAVDFASRVNAEVVLLHVGAPEPDFVGYGIGPASVRDAVADELREEHRRLETLRQVAESRGVTARVSLVRGPTVETILARASSTGAAYVFIGSKGRSLMHDLVVGGVTRGVLKDATVPVVVVPVAK